MSDTAAVPAGYMQDAEGRLVPADKVKPQHVLEDQVVREIVDLALEESRRLSALKVNIKTSVDAFVELVAERYGVERAGRKGNMTLTSFDGSLQLQVAVGQFIDFGPELQIAKQLIDQCLTAWSANGSDELKVIVTDAFRVNKEGKLDKDRILGLRRHNFGDERWKQAMAAISDSIKVQRSKEYFRLYRRPAPDRDFEQIPLDIARV
ncbi:DUF3164 family protein [Zavarzinia aquatilis]|uniref:Sulfate transporter n=1 Tax=Zavarzinia aquatilis TaxID=2211142 RepID=A0A317DXI8_9PROT|nr:DUF3164 family protein [Zavarzinia aquatilis]PWR17663.1 sulfate transporter [Zavarzinia aquatilis]